MICTDSQGHGFLYDVLRAKPLKELGKIDLKEEIEARNRQEFIPNWFSADVKTGVCILYIVHFNNPNFI